MTPALRLVALFKGVGAFTLTLNRQPILLNGQIITFRRAA